VNGPPIIVLEPVPATGGLAQLLDDDDAAESVPDGSTAVRRLRDHRSDGTSPFVVIGPSIPRPLAVAQAVRRIDPDAGLAFVMDAETVDPMEVRLALVPELGNSLVLPADAAPDELARSVHEAATVAGRRRDVRHALDAMNRELLRTPSTGTRSARQSVSQAYLAAVTRHAPEAIVSVDLDGRILSMNDAAVRTLGLERQHGEGARLTDALGGGPGSELAEIVADASAGHTHERHELRLETPDQREVLLMLTAAPVRDYAGHVVGTVIIARDVTAERRTQARLRELQKAESLATLAGGVAHDFNNLLVSVKGWAEIAREDPHDVETLETALHNISSAAERAAELARAMLAYGGRGTVELEPTDVNELIDEMVGLLRTSVSRKIELRTELGDRLPTIHADRTQLRQVVLNLVTNASEAIGEETGTIHLRSYHEELASDRRRELGVDELHVGPHVVVEVSDTGPGMDEQTRERIFDPFFTTKFTGRGLGLAASRGIAIAHGGAIAVDTAPGRGATFRLVLPSAPTSGGTT
jgi:PAS domain S-box-containing protein